MTGSPLDDPRPARTPDSAAERPAAEPVPAAASTDAAPVGTAPAVPGVSAPPEPEPGPEPRPERNPENGPPEPEPGVRVADVVDRRTVRQAPRFGRFILAGVALGAVLALLLAFLTPPSQYARSDLFWILFLGIGFICGIAAAGLAVVLDRRSLARREARTAARRTPPAA